MEKLKKQVEIIKATEAKLVAEKATLDQMIHEKFLEVNNLQVDSKFKYNDKEIIETFVKDCKLKGRFATKTGAASKTALIIELSKEFKIV